MARLQATQAEMFVATDLQVKVAAKVALAWVCCRLTCSNANAQRPIQQEFILTPPTRKGNVPQAFMLTPPTRKGNVPQAFMLTPPTRKGNVPQAFMLTPPTRKGKMEQA
jgi:hypothetical protein